MTRRLPPWLKVKLPSDSGDLKKVAKTLRDKGLTTVCTGARCPNLAECWSCGTATVMILGNQCTRGCRFCAVDHGAAPPPPDSAEPQQVAAMARELQLSYVVITSVTRDDLPDQGASQFAATVQAVRNSLSHTKVELLVPDFSGRTDLLDIVLDARPDVIGHNLETVRRLTPLVRDAKADFDRSLDVLKYLSQQGAVVKTALLLGLGETRKEVVEAFTAAYHAGARHLAMGQYLAPSGAHTQVDRYWTPEEFAQLGKDAEALGFHSVASAPLVRSSYQAHRFAGSDFGQV